MPFKGGFAIFLAMRATPLGAETMGKDGLGVCRWRLVLPKPTVGPEESGPAKVGNFRYLFGFKWAGPGV